MNSGEEVVGYPESCSNAGQELRDSPYSPRPIERDEPTEEQIAIYRAMTPERRLQIGEQMYWEARRWKAAGVRMLHPDWTEEQIEREVSRIFLNARS